MKTILTAFCLLSSLVLGCHTAPDANPIRRTLDRHVGTGRIAGVVSVISDPDGNVQTDCAGWADAENRRPMRPDTLFAIFSMTKTFTGMALMVAAPKGQG